MKTGGFRQGTQGFLLSIPRPLVESMILMSFVVSTLVLIRGGYFSKSDTILGDFAVCFQRIALCSTDLL